MVCHGPCKRDLGDSGGDMDRNIHKENCLNCKTSALIMQALLFLGDSLTFRFFSLQLYMILVACLILLLVFFTLFFMETLFQLVCASDLVNAKAPGAFGTKPHVLLNMPTCTCIFVLKSLYVWTTRPKICFLPVRLAVNEDSLTWCTVLSKEWKRKLQRCSSLLWSFLCHGHPVSWLPIWTEHGNLSNLLEKT